MGVGWNKLGESCSGLRPAKSTRLRDGLRQCSWRDRPVRWDSGGERQRDVGVEWHGLGESYTPPPASNPTARLGHCSRTTAHVAWASCLAVSISMRVLLAMSPTATHGSGVVPPVQARATPPVLAPTTPARAARGQIALSLALACRARQSVQAVLPPWPTTAFAA